MPTPDLILSTAPARVLLSGTVFSDGFHCCSSGIILTNLFLWLEFQAVQLLLLLQSDLVLCFLTLFFSFPIDLSMSPCSCKVCVEMSNVLDRRRTGEGKPSN